MSDDDKTKKDETKSDDAVVEVAADAPADAEPEAASDEEEKPAEEASPDAPIAEEVPKDAPTPAASAEPAGTDQQGRTLYNVKCSNCGKDTQVPFQPSGDRPVYCRDCYMQKKNAQG